MKLDFEIVRSVLLEIEKDTDLNNHIVYKKDNTDSDKFYALTKLKEAGFLNCKEQNTWGGTLNLIVFSLTWQGHEFLDNIRSPKTMEHITSSLQTVGSASLTIVSELAKSYLLNQLGL